MRINMLKGELAIKTGSEKVWNKVMAKESNLSQAGRDLLWAMRSMHDQDWEAAENRLDRATENTGASKPLTTYEWHFAYECRMEMKLSQLGDRKIGQAELKKIDPHQQYARYTIAHLRSQKKPSPEIFHQLEQLVNKVGTSAILAQLVFAKIFLVMKFGALNHPTIHHESRQEIYTPITGTTIGSRKKYLGNCWQQSPYFITTG